MNDFAKKVVLALILSFSGLNAFAESVGGQLTKVQTDGDGGFFIKMDPEIASSECYYSGIYFRGNEMTEATLKRALSVALTALTTQSGVVVYYDKNSNLRCYATVIAVNRKG